MPEVLLPPVVESARVADPLRIAREEFEILHDSSESVGTQKLFARGEFLPLDDPRGMSDGDFIGRLRALFGPTDNDEYVLRHRPTGQVVIAYSAQSGPSYGGAPDLDRMEERIAADPIVRRGRPVDWSQYNIERVPEPLMLELRKQEHAWQRHVEEVSAGPELTAAVTRLDALLASISPADWSVVRYWADDPTVYRVGAQNGVAFDETLRGRAGLDVLLAAAEDARGNVHDTDGSSDPDERVISFWEYHAGDASLSEARPHVHAAWFRWAARVAERGGDTRMALDLARQLGIEDARARDALTSR
jgi:hypothetical protein